MWTTHLCISHQTSLKFSTIGFFRTSLRQIVPMIKDLSDQTHKLSDIHFFDWRNDHVRLEGAAPQGGGLWVG